MVLKNGYLALALSLQEAATKDPDKFTAKLNAALAAETEDSAWKRFLEAGARHSASDMGHLQAIHDASMVLGAKCGGAEELGEARQLSDSSGQLKLTESASTLDPIVLREARADYEIKLIAPGKGSSAFYPAEVLKRDGPKVFKAGTHVYLNHPTRAEEAARPEGDVANLAGVLTTDAVYHEAHAKGAGLYGRMKVFADHGALVEEKAAHVGMSIRASGIAESGKKQEGLPILKELTGAESVDVVTRAGAGGMILTEAAASAPPIQPEEVSMTEAEAKVLIEAAVSPFKARALRGDAREEAARLLKDIELPEAAKTKITERAVATLPTTETGELDTAKFRECIVQESRSEAEYLAGIVGPSKVRGMGASAPVAPKPEEIAAREAAEKTDYAAEVALWESLGMERTAAEFAAKGRAA